MKAKIKLGQHRPTSAALCHNGQVLAVGMDNGTVMLLEIATRSICLDFGGHIGAVNDLSFSPDGKLLASAGSDGTVLLWDCCLLSLAKADPPAMTEQTLAKLWSDLGAKEAKVAFRASNLFCRQPKQSSAFVEKQLQDLWKFDPKEIRRLIAQLNDKSYSAREKAFAELLHWEDWRRRKSTKRSTATRPWSLANDWSCLCANSTPQRLRRSNCSSCVRSPSSSVRPRRGAARCWSKWPPARRNRGWDGRPV